ncbi:hypothetical protein C8J57DRAFT_1522684 [Mycena rebaudengoi]|nr:hypothetical protein C8J57DRAFT_1522684 [Mycena rebaudengoi]
MVTSIQVPKGAMHPAIGNKFYGVEDKAYTKCKRFLQQVTGKVSMAGLQEGPPGLADLPHDQGDIMNVALIGAKHDHCFSAVQANIIHPIPLSSVTGDSEHIKDLGEHVGGSHVNKGNEDAGVPATTSLSKLEEDIDQGFIVVLELGFALVLIPLCVSFFCECCPYGSISPMYENMRCLILAYITSTALSGHGICAFAALPDNKLLMIGPEI